MATNLLWFVMAGFLLGFATSTLWEWFYFRKERLKLTDRRIRELEAKLRDAEAANDSSLASDIGIASDADRPVPTVAAVTQERTRTSAWGDTPYRSPGVFLESEEVEADRDDVDVETMFGPDRAPDVSSQAGVSKTQPVVPTVDSISPKPTGSSSTAASSTASPAPQYVPPKSQPMPAARPPLDEGAAATHVSRTEQPSPAESLRAKLAGTGRSRQEVLAALRRNSEAMQRGEYPPPDAPRSTALPPGEPARTLVTPIEPTGDAVQATPTHEPAARPEPSPPALSPARLRWVNDPKLTARTKEYPDDLSKIKGIGDVYKQRLYRAGIYTWKQIVETDTETLRRATSAYPSSNVEEWLTQAEALMAKHGRQDAVYSGPPPDDMTKILGIGPVSASTLYRAGICTYEQLASTPLADLEALFPIAVAGDVPDFAQWIERAATLADEKHREPK